MVDDAEVLKENLTTEQIGELFVAVMDYLQTGTVVEVSQAVKYPYADYRKKVDRACTSYDEIVAKRAESGRKGGTAKAAKVKEAQATPKFKPPTLSQFKNAIYRFIENGEFDNVDDYDIETFYDELKENNWCIGSAPILIRNDWESAIIEKFSDINFDGEHYQLFKIAFEEGRRDEDGESIAVQLVYRFRDKHDMNQPIQVLKRKFRQYLSENRPP